MRQIDFFIIGAQKAATTALYTYLGRHPEIYVPAVKEIPFFARDDLFTRGERELAPFYRDAAPGQMLGLAYAQMMYFRHTAERVFNHNPGARCIAVLRNPVDRAYSAYWFSLLKGWETAATFEDALDLEPRRSSGSFKQQTLTYVAHGRYAEQLAPYLARFGRDKVKVLLTEDLRDAAVATVQDLLGWLQVTPDTSGLGVGEKVWEAGAPRWKGLHHALMNDDQWIRKALRRAIPAAWRYRFRARILLPLLRRNIRPEQPPPMAEATRQRLKELFAEDNRRLSGLIGRDLSAWG